MIYVLIISLLFNLLVAFATWWVAKKVHFKRITMADYLRSGIQLLYPVKTVNCVDVDFKDVVKSIFKYGDAVNKNITSFVVGSPYPSLEVLEEGKSYLVRVDNAGELPGVFNTDAQQGYGPPEYLVAAPIVDIAYNTLLPKIFEDSLDSDMFISIVGMPAGADGGTVQISNPNGYSVQFAGFTGPAGPTDSRAIYSYKMKNGAVQVTAVNPANI